MMIIRSLFFSFLLLSTFSQPIHSEEEANNQLHVEAIELQQEQNIPLEHDGGHEKDDFQSRFIHMLTLLVLLIGFMILASWALKRMMNSRVTQINQSSVIKVIETRHLSPKATLHLVDINGETVLIAESPSSVTHIASFRSPLEQV